MAERFTNPVPQMLDTNGDPVAGGKLNFFENTATTPQDTFSDTALSVANANPVILDGDGRAPNIFMQEALYTVRLDDADGVEIWTRDNVASIADLNDHAITYAALKAIDVTSLTEGQVIPVWGRTASGDGGEGDFKATQVNPGADNGGTILHSDTAGWYFVRQGVVKFNPKWWGAVGSSDDSAETQAAIDYITTLDDGGTLVFPADRYTLGDVILKNKVRIEGETKQGYPNPSLGPVTQFIGLAAASWVIDTPVTQVNSTSISGISFEGTGAGNGQGGVRIRLANAATVANCSFNDFDEQAILGDAVGASTFKDNKAQGCLLERTRSGKNGVLQITGSDNWIIRGEYTASSSLEDAISDANLRVCAVAILGSSGNNWVDKTVCEISDIGLYVEGSFHKIFGVRCDLNYAHGFQDMSDNSQYIGNHAHKNGRHADATYNDFDIIAGASSGVFIGNSATASETNRTNFAFADAIASNTAKHFYVGNVAFGQRDSTYSMNATSGGAVTVHQGPAKTFTDLDLTPSVDNYSSFKWFEPSAFTVTDFDDGVSGQDITVINQSNSDVLVENGSNIARSGGVTAALRPLVPYRFFNFLDKWYEITTQSWIKHATEHLSVSSGTELDWTGIPVNVTQIKIVFDAHSSGTADDDLAVRIGDAGGFETSGYAGRVVNTSAGTDWSTMAVVTNAAAQANVISGEIMLTNITGNNWAINGTTTVIGGTMNVSAGSKTLTAVLTQVRLLFDSTGTFDGGGNYVLYYQ